MSMLAAALACTASRAEDDAIASLTTVARECGDLAVSASLKTDPKVVPDKAHDIFLQCKMQWFRVAIATIEAETNDKVANFRNRKDAQKLYRALDATSIRLESEEEARLREGMRALSMQPAPKQR